MLNRLLPCLLFLLFPTLAYATCNTSTLVTTPDSASVQACINAAVAGQTVTVSSGSASWSTTVTITKGLTLIASGTVTITNTANPAIRVTGTGSAFVRISGFTINAGGSNQAAQDAVATAISLVGPISQFRGDHLSFNRGDCAICTNTIYDQSGTGPVYGVVDHSTFMNMGRAYFAQDLRTTDSSGNAGSVAWGEFLGHEATFPGSSKFMFFEDDTFVWNAGVNSGQSSVYGQYGGKVVFRHNTISGWGYQIDAHGDQNPSGYGTIMYEMYNNTFTESCAVAWFGCEGKDFYLRGGQFIIHDNTFNSQDIPVQLTVYNSNDLTTHRIHNTFYWNNTWCDGNGNNCVTNPSTQVEIDPSTNAPLTLNVDYFERAPKAGDLYYPYTPYTYPHPLQGGGVSGAPAAPAGLAASVN
jgi:hypothetical protein